MTEVRVVHVVAAAIVDSGRCLIGRRPAGGSAGDLWEFPGGKVEPGETPEGALIREIHEELGVDIEVGMVLGRSEHVDEHRHVILDLYAASWKGGSFEARAHSELRWTDRVLPPAELFAPADRPLLHLVAAHLAPQT